MKNIKLGLEIILITIISLCAFGGGLFVFGLPLLWILQPSPAMVELIVFMSIFVPMPFAWWIAPKISDKIF